MANKKLVLAYSGGLDTSYCLMKLSKEGYQVHAATVNTGGFDELQIEDMQAKAIQMGAHTYKSIDALSSFYQKVLETSDKLLQIIHTMLKYPLLNENVLQQSKYHEY